jgi:hypothetical protein
MADRESDDSGIFRHDAALLVVAIALHRHSRVLSRTAIRPQISTLFAGKPPASILVLQIILIYASIIAR